MAKIAKADREPMNALFSNENARMTGKTAAEKIDAFKDHAEYVATIENVLADDKQESWDPNDPVLD